MDSISIGMDELEKRSARHRVRFGVAVGEDRSSIEPWGVASNASATGMFVETRNAPPKGKSVRLWVVDGHELRDVQARVARHDEKGVGVCFDDQSFSAWLMSRALAS